MRPVELARSHGRRPTRCSSTPTGRLRAAVLPKLILVDDDGTVAYEKYVEIKSLAQLEQLVEKHLGVARDSPSLPEWLEPIREGRPLDHGRRHQPLRPARGVRGPQGRRADAVRGGPAGPDLLLTERAHDMRSHPGQVSFPGGSIDDTDASPEAAALREAEEETGLDPAGVEVFATLPELWLPPSNFAVTAVLGWWQEPSRVDVVDPAEVNAVLRVPIEELLDPTAPGDRDAPDRLQQPGLPDRGRQGPHPVGLHRGSGQQAVRPRRADAALGRVRRRSNCRTTCSA